LFGGNTSDLYDAARYAQAFRPIVGDSGTATRMMPIDALNLALTLPTNVATRAYTSGPVTAMAGGARQGLLPNIAGDAGAQALQRVLPLTGGLGLLGSLTN
jgi:hypothetical protein